MNFFTAGILSIILNFLLLLNFKGINSNLGEKLFKLFILLDKFVLLFEKNVLVLILLSILELKFFISFESYTYLECEFFVIIL